ncbi:MAG: arsenosugar biosynthesis radical SAM protein ArsS [Candidatus Stygibacter australis]|nr:arsenosugar biosynthesis radical SAM protein ArsS [Candidatus Stygibacter australis]MDP8320884.1 arsenosugar biosynthesis radical SAM protein ArsS [Candidatus Stygibacter australis]
MNIESQLKYLEESSNGFEQTLSKHEKSVLPLKAISLKTFQVNIGRKCNQACRHCHVNSSPESTLEMTLDTVEMCLDVIRNVPEIETLDLTGGAPEMNAHFCYFVTEAIKAGKHVIDRCNLTILEEPGYEYLYEFLAANQVEIVASLPHFRPSGTDRQRGSGIYDKSIIALQKLNKLGYGKTLPLNLVYNPTGIFISSSQEQLEMEYKKHLFDTHGIVFNKLYCINNVPINRFLESLIKIDKFDEYMEILVDSFNFCTIDNLMCRYQISVGYDGNLYDCDFNQMLELQSQPIGHISKFDAARIKNRKIRLANHCFACTAGSGSS